MLISLFKQRPLTWAGIKKLLPSITLMVVVNLIPLVGVIWFGWSVFALLVLFWIENIIIGLFNVPRILMARGHENAALQAVGDKVTPLIVWFTALFFLVHYGGFAFGHGTFVFSMIGGYQADGSRYEITDVFEVIGEYELLIAVLGLVISHGFSFGYNYLYKEKYKEAVFIFQMFKPYKRVIMLHVTIIFGGALITAMGEPLLGLLVLLMVKIYMDIKAHVHEYAREANPFKLEEAFIAAINQAAKQQERK